MITDNQIYTYAENKVKTAFPLAECSSISNPTPETLPACQILVTGNEQTREGQTLTNDDTQRRSTFTVNTYAETLYEANALMDSVEGAFKEMLFRKTMRNPIDNQDIRIKRVTARFSRLIGGGDTIGE